MFLGNGSYKLPDMIRRSLLTRFLRHKTTRSRGRYERDEIKPSIDIATKIADALGVSLDYLTGKTNVELDNSIIKRVVEIQSLSDEDKKHILYALDGLLQNVRTKLAFGK